MIGVRPSISTSHCTRRYEVPKLALAGICTLTFLSRILGQWSKVFIDGAVIFRGQDSWYHMRLAQVSRANFPYYIHNDYFVNPGGQPPVGWPPFLTYLIAAPGLLLSEHQTEVYAALLPPIIAVLVVVVVYFLAKEVLRSKAYALVAALLVGLLPSQFMQKTLLGFTDHHMLEVLFVSLALLFLLKGKYILLGLTLGALFWTWTGAGYIILILTLGVLAELYRKYIKGEAVHRLAAGFLIAVIIAFFIFLPVSRYSVARTENLFCCVAGVGVSLTFVVLSSFITSKKIFLTTTLLGGIGLTIATVFALPVASWWGAVFNRGSTTVISEFTPLSVSSAFSNFGLALLLFVPGFVLFVKERNNLILPIFILPILISTINQIRFGYYLIIPVAIFTVYFIRWTAEKVNPEAVVATVIIIFILATSLTNIIHTATFQNTMSPGMYQALNWIRYNTPTPEGDFYSLHSQQPNYQVLGWWDQSTWTAYVAKRAPLVSPTSSQIPEMTEFFIDGNIKRVQAPASKWYGDNLDIRYIVVDKDMQWVSWIQYLTDSENTSPWVFNLIGWQSIYQNNEAVVLEKSR